MALHQAGCAGGEPERFWISSMNLRILTSPKVLQPYSGLKQPPMAVIEGTNSSSHIGSRFYTIWAGCSRTSPR